MQELIQGQGIIDIVNTYVGIALRFGLVGIGLHSAFFVSVLLGLWKKLNSLPANEAKLKQTGGALLATLIGVLVTLGTVSSVGHISMITFTIAGLCVAYTRIAQRHLDELSKTKP